MGNKKYREVNIDIQFSEERDAVAIAIETSDQSKLSDQDIIDSIVDALMMSGYYTKRANETMN